MTVMDQWSQKVQLPRAGMGELWTRVQDHFAKDDPRLWRYLAMFVLRDVAGWTLQQVALALGTKPGQVSRCLPAVRNELRRRFAREPMTPEVWDMLSDPDEFSAPESPTTDFDSPFADEERHHAH
ncbi:MAG: hypothetical protein B7Z55_09800 [Planctomycetales bacterium 12-60-4]|nr:MAG: hypothetical protein B7Z55_09800 [Planctomycetales bacterium 12-60-4]